MQKLKHFLPRLPAHKVSQDFAVISTEGLVGGHSEGRIARGDDPATHHGNGQLHAALGCIEAGQGVDEQIDSTFSSELCSLSAVVVDDARKPGENGCAGTSSDVGFTRIVAKGPVDCMNL